ncbi:hypothetical protein, partial [Lichenifustis flavocetrariae]
LQSKDAAGNPSKILVANQKFIDASLGPHPDAVGSGGVWMVAPGSSWITVDDVKLPSIDPNEPSILRSIELPLKTSEYVPAGSTARFATSFGPTEVVI